MVEPTLGNDGIGSCCGLEAPAFRLRHTAINGRELDIDGSTGEEDEEEEKDQWHGSRWRHQTAGSPKTEKQGSVSSGATTTKDNFTPLQPDMGYPIRARIPRATLSTHNADVAPPVARYGILLEQGIPRHRHRAGMASLHDPSQGW